MYSEYFGLTENPFTLTPDPRFLFMSDHHREALAHLLYGMGEKGGFVLLTGEVGTGKTTLCRSLLDQVPEDVEVALILNPKQTAIELVASLCDELKVNYPEGTQSLKVLVDVLNQHLLQVHSEGRRTVLIIDEAQNLSFDVLEQIRLLTNLETPTRKLLQILLIGQPELQSMMADPELRQLGQRVTARYHLTPLLLPETIAYVQYRLEVGGCKRDIFTKRALHLVHRLSKGVPRLINTICDRALLGAYAKRRERINRRLVRKAAAEVMGDTSGSSRSLSWGRVIGWATAASVLLVLAAGGYFYHTTDTWPIFPAQKHEARLDPAKGDPPTVAKGTGDDKSTETVGQKQDSVSDPPDSGAAHAGSPIAVSEQGSSKAAEVSKDALDSLLEGKIRTDPDSAFAVLTQCWGTAYEELPGRLPCDRVSAAGLRCLKGQGNWTTLSHLNRPAIIELTTPEGKRLPVPVVALKGDKVTLVLEGERQSVPRGQVDPFWYGEYTVLWRRPPLGSTLLKKGDRGRDVLWLRAKLDLAQGRTPQGDIPSPLFDAALEKRVIEFQRCHCMRADGMVGEQTVIQLNEAAGDPPVPLLNRTVQKTIS